MYVKIHTSKDSSVVAVCDEELLGKTLTDETRELEVSESFYKGEVKTEEETLALIKTANNVNLIGKKAVALGLQAGIITQENVIEIAGVPHAQSLSF